MLSNTIRRLRKYLNQKNSFNICDSRSRYWLWAIRSFESLWSLELQKAREDHKDLRAPRVRLRLFRRHGLQEREQHNVADGRGARQDHDEPVDADAQTTAGGIPNFSAVTKSMSILVKDSSWPRS